MAYFLFELEFVNYIEKRIFMFDPFLILDSKVSGQSVFRGFDTELLSDAFNNSTEPARSPSPSKLTGRSTNNAASAGGAGGAPSSASAQSVIMNKYPQPDV